MTHSEEQIAQFIKHFLHRHNELCIAGLGRFISEEQECVVDPVAKFIYPASHKVNFAHGNFETSPEFISFLEKHSGINQVTEKLANFGKSIKEEVLSTKKLEIEDLGFFKLNVLGEIDFEPFKHSNYKSSSFGLKPVHFAANLLKVKRLEVVPEEEDDADPEVALMRESALKELKVMLDQAKIAESSSEVKGNKIFPIVATVLTLILLVNLGFFLFNGKLGQANQGISKTDMLGKTGEVLQESITSPTNTASPSVKPEKTPSASLEVENSYDLTFKHIGNVYAKDSFEFDSLFYSQVFTTDSLSAVLEPKTEIVPDVKVQPAVYQEPINEMVSVNAVAENAEMNNMAPEMLNADAKENGIVAGFYVVAGAFKQDDNAGKLVIRLRKAGYKEAITVKPEKYPYHIAAYERYPTLNGALDLAERMQAKGKKVWIYCAF